MRGETVPQNVIYRVKPTRDELVKIYKYIMAVKRVSIDKLFMKFNTQSMNYFKLRIALDAFNELGLIKLIASRQEVHMVEVTKRVDLSKSTVLNKIYSLSYKSKKHKKRLEIYSKSSQFFRIILCYQNE